MTKVKAGADRIQFNLPPPESREALENLVWVTRSVVISLVS